MKRIKIAIGAMVLSAVAGVNVWVANETSELSASILALGDDIRNYYYENGEVVPVGSAFSNWATYRVLVECETSVTTFFTTSSEKYKVELDKCGFGDGDCWFDETCFTH